MSKFLDYNEARGTWYETDYEAHTDKLVIHTKQDVQPVLEDTKFARNSGVGDKGVKGEFWHYASIPAHVEVELKNKGINIYDKNNTSRLLKEINQNYPYLKRTNLHHE